MTSFGGRVGSGEIKYIEGNVETAFERAPSGGNQSGFWVHQFTDVIKFVTGDDPDDLVESPFGTGDRQGLFEKRIFNDPSNWEFRLTRNLICGYRGIEQMGSADEPTGLRVRLTPRVDRKSGFTNYVYSQILGEAGPAAEQMDRTEVIDLLIGNSPADAFALTETPGIKGTSWAGLIVDRQRVETDLGLTVEDGVYA